MLEIRASHNQIGLSIEARETDKDQTWQLVQVSKYRGRGSTSVRQYSTCIDPLQDELDYFAFLDKQGIQYRKVQANP
jgi:hypothetical protein